MVEYKCMYAWNELRYRKLLLSLIMPPVVTPWLCDTDIWPVFVIRACTILRKIFASIIIAKTYH